VVGLLVQPEAALEPFLVSVERVRVLHDELAHPQEPAPRPGLVAHLRLEVVEDLRQLAVRADLARMEGDRLLVGQREDERPAEAVLELPELGNRVAARRLPELGRRHDRHEHLLAPDRVHLLPDDLDDLLMHAPSQWEIRPQADGRLPDKATADEQAVAHGLGIARVLPEGGNEELGGPHY
jgi:hypothetical protein